MHIARSKKMSCSELLESRRLLNATFDNLFIPDQSVNDSIQLDIDGDADLDIVATSRHSLTLHRNSGGRSFQTTPVLPYSASGRVVEHLLKFDFDRNGADEALAVCSLGSSLDLCRITPSGMEVIWAVNLGASSIGATAGDFNGDGYLDLTVSSQSGTALRTRFWVGSAEAPFTLFSDTADTGGTYSAVDVEGDGDLDLLGHYSWRENLGSNVFAPSTWTPVASLGNSWAGGPAIADFDGDGDFDYAIAVGLNSSATVSKLNVYSRGPEGLTLSRSTNIISRGAKHLIAEDLDDDGDKDLLLGGSIFRNEGDMRFDFDRFLTSVNAEHQPRLADIDSDGRLDLAIGNSSGYSGFQINWGSRLQLDAAYTDRFNHSLYDAETLDFNGDGFDDVIGLRAFESSGYFSLLMNSDGGYSSYGLNGSPSVNIFNGWGAGDFNKDGRDDLAISATMSNGGSAIVIYHANGSTLAFRQQIAFSSSLYGDVGVGDFDADGDLDLTTGSSRKVQFLNNDGAGTFTSGAQSDIPVSVRQFLTGDFDGNGLDDLALVDNSRLVVGLNVEGSGLAFGPAIPTGQTINDADVVKRFGSDQHDILIGTSTQLARFVFDASSGWSSSTLSAHPVNQLAVRDLNDDEEQEIVIGITSTQLIAILHASAQGYETTLHPIHSSANELHLTDFDRDGDIDIVAWSAYGIGSAAAITVVHSQTFEDTTVPQLTVRISYDNSANIIAYFDFTENISRFLTVPDLTMRNVVTGQLVTLPIAMFSSGALSLGLNINRGSLVEGRYELAVLPGRVTDSSGNVVAPLVVSIYNLTGDLDHDGAVGSSDLLILAQNYGNSGRTYSQGNVNFSNGGLVDFADLLILAQRYGASLNQAPPLATFPIVTRKRALVSELDAL